LTLARGTRFAAAIALPAVALVACLLLGPWTFQVRPASPSVAPTASPDGRIAGGTWGGSAIGVSETGTRAGPGTGIPKFPVDFTGTGLPAGARWSVSVGGTNFSGVGPTVRANLTNGTYSYSVAPPAGWLLSPTNGTVTVAGVPTDRLPSLPGYFNTLGVLADPANGLLYLPNATGNVLSLVNAVSHALVTKLGIGGAGWTPVLGSTGAFVYVVANNAGNVSVVNTTTNRIDATLTVGQAPWLDAYDPASGHLYTPNSASNNISVIDTADHASLTSLATDTQPTTVVPLPDLGQLLVASLGTTPSIDLIDLSNGSIVHRVPTYMLEPSGGAYVPSLGEVFLADTTGGRLLTIYASNGTLVGSQALPGIRQPWAPLYDPANGMIYVASMNDARLAVYDPVTRQSIYNLGLAGVPSSPSLDAGNGFIIVPDYSGPGIEFINGTPTTVTLPFVRGPVSYPVTFSESGLLPGTNWSVTLAGNGNSSTGRSIGFVRLNGSWNYSVSPVAGFRATPGSGTLTVNGSSVDVTVSFQPVMYPVTFVESGLPPSTSWTVSVNGSPHSSTTRSIQIPEPNGTYGYDVVPFAGFAAPPSGQVSVNGSGATVAVPFTVFTYSVTFVEQGLSFANGADWGISVGGAPVRSTTSSIAFSEPNGTFAYAVTGAAGYKVTPTSGMVTIAGSTTSVAIHFSVFVERFSVTFDESGLPSATAWSVEMVDTVKPSTGPTVAFSGLANGTYPYSVPPVAGYSWSPTTTDVAVAGSNVTVGVPFVAEPAQNGAPGFALGGVPLIDWAIVGATAAVVAAVLGLRRVRRRPPDDDVPPD
jgi:YVTN family beta-propeller protein